MRDAMSVDMPVVKCYDLSELTPDPNNARLHDDRNLDALRDSLNEFGQYKPIVVQKSTGRIIAGNGRYEVMRRLGMKQVAAVVLDVDDRTATRIALTDNRTGELGEWDKDKLAELTGQFDWDDEPIPGWTFSELEDMFAPIDQALREGDGIDAEEFNEAEADKCTCPRCGYRFKA